MSTTRDWADSLEQARLSGVPIAPLTEVDPDLSVEAAYEIQLDLTARLLASGAELRGYKLGLTSDAMRASLGVDEPDFGPVVSTLMDTNGATLSMSGLIQPRIEAEIGLYLDRPLSGPGVTEREVRDAVSSGRAVLEVVDSRVVDWRIGLVDTVADLASTALVVTGGPPVPLADFEPRLCGVAVYHNGDLVAASSGAAALGDPLAAVAWLANRLGAMGTTLQAGHLILTGALHAAVPFSPGDEFEAVFDHLGSVRVTVEAET